MNVRGATICLAFGLVGVAGCDDDHPTAPPVATPTATSAASAANAGGKVEWSKWDPGGDFTAFLVAERARAAADGRDLLVYVGAEWCEPCKRFHAAVERGELDSTFPSLRIIELDADRDEQVLAASGCSSRLIPLFAAPTAEGRCDPEKRISGSIKGDGAVANIVPRLRTMLASGER